MEAYSSSNSSYLTQNREESKHVYPHYSVRKSATNKKAPVAPMPAAPVKVYRVDAVNFRDLVQQLTGAPEHKPQPTQQLLLQSNITDAPSNSLPNQNPFSGGDTACTKWHHNFQFGMSSHF
ncbi:hypothetical protein Fmac_027239 [Flemingia macrophylla]|uniref:VQ domain-containing protein n=1 Tax=Flemingia macrophylla TaxID=520843 RepID=A0ABD1LH43_9FABA